MAIRLMIGASYLTRNGLGVEVLGRVSNDFVGRMVTQRDGTKVFIPIPFYRAKFKDTQEVVFYSANGNIISEKPGADDSKYAINKPVAA